MAVAVAEVSEPRLLFQAASTDLPAALDLIRTTPNSGVILTGSVEARKIRAIREGDSALPLTVDVGVWRTDAATAERPLGVVDNGGLVGFGLDDFVDGLVEAGASRVLAPTLAVPVFGWEDIFASIFRELDASRRSEVLPYFPIQTSILNETNMVALERSLATFGRPVAITLLGARDSMAANGRLAVLRSLVDRGFIEFVFATEPLIATDVLARDASAVSIGVSSSLRMPQMPGGKIPQSRGREPGVFHRQILEIRSPGVFADWYAGRADAPVCVECGCSLTIYRRNQHEAFLRHNIHASASFGNDLLVVESTMRKGWLAQERNTALAAHPLAVTKTDASRVLRRLVELDGLEPNLADLPVSAV